MLAAGNLLENRFMPDVAAHDGDHVKKCDVMFPVPETERGPEGASFPAGVH